MMLVKISSDIPLPTPRCVISSDSHMISAVPAVMTSTISRTLPVSKVFAGKTSAPSWPEWNRNTSPVACRIASTTVR